MLLQLLSNRLSRLYLSFGNRLRTNVSTRRRLWNGELLFARRGIEQQRNVHWMCLGSRQLERVAFQCNPFLDSRNNECDALHFPDIDDADAQSRVALCDLLVDELFVHWRKIHESSGNELLDNLREPDIPSDTHGDGDKLRSCPK